jgi:beta-lactamase regulating signal transducer with metallopeptidase domain
VSELLRLILANALTTGLLALAAWVASRRVRRQSLVHGLWLLALVKLLTPPIVPLPLLPEWTMPSPGLTQAPTIVVIPDSSRGPRSSARPEAARGAGLSAVVRAEPRVAVRKTPRTLTVDASSPSHDGLLGMSVGEETVPTEVRPSWDTVDLASLAWAGLLMGALVVAALALLRIRRFQRLLRLGTPAPQALRGRVAELAGRVGLRHAPPVLLLPARVPPMLWPGRRGPVLLMPAGLLPELGEEERDTLLVHELAHVRRRDHWVRFLELAVTSLFWWYPVAWWVRRALRRAEERCCDEWVLRVMPGSAGAYADGLLKSLDLLAGEPDPLPIGASGVGPVRDLEARLKEILMTTRPTPTLATSARLLFATVALLGLAVFPTRAQSPSPEPDPAVSSPAETPPRPAGVPEAPESPDAAPVAPAPATPAEASPPDASVAPAPPARPADSLAPTLPTIPAEPTPAVAPFPEPAPDVAPPAPAPPVGDVALAPGPPTPAPHPAPLAAPALAPPPPLPGTTPAPVVAPGAEEAPEDEAAWRELEEQRRKLEAQRTALHRRELELARERVRREAQAQQDELRAEAARLRAAGQAERAALVEEHARTAARRHELQEREITLEQARLAEQATRQEREHALQQREMEAEAAAQAAQAKELEARELEVQGRHDEAAAARAEAEERRHEAKSLQRAVMEDHLLRSTADLELQMESQLEALRHLQAEGADDDNAVQDRIRRLEAALGALRAREE